ncbi:unnamed protein product [Boreogadus saida]
MVTRRFASPGSVFHPIGCHLMKGGWALTSLGPARGTDAHILPTLCCQHIYLSQLSDHGPRNAQLGNALLLRVDGSWYEVMQLDFEVDNVINLVPTQTLHWQVEYRPPPAGGQSPPTTERATHLYIGNADIQGIVPLAEPSQPPLRQFFSEKEVQIAMFFVPFEGS